MRVCSLDLWGVDFRLLIFLNLNLSKQYETKGRLQGNGNVRGILYSCLIIKDVSAFFVRAGQTGIIIKPGGFT